MDTQNRAARKKHHVIYKTTCSVTGRYYIGMHSTDNLEDGYKGSGKKLWQSIKKYGEEAHTCEILEHLPSREALRLRETELVNEELIGDSMCMNIALGGTGSWDHVNENYTPEQRSRVGKLGGFANMHLWSKETKASWLEKVTVSNRKRWRIFLESNPEEVSRRRSLGQLKALSLESKEKRKDSFRQIGHQQGDKNSQFGTCWVTNGIEAKKISKDDLTNYLERGYKPGRSVT